jgi:hypothetical protein
MGRINSPLGQLSTVGRLDGFKKLSLCILAVIAGAAINSDVFSPVSTYLGGKKTRRPRSITGSARAPVLGLRGQTSSSVKPRQFPSPCVWPRKE